MNNFELLSIDIVSRVLDEAFQLLQKPGIKIQDLEARTLLLDAGAIVHGDIVKIPERVIRKALDTVPAEFQLYDGDGSSSVYYGGDAIQFDPGSCGVHILDPETGIHRPSETADLVRLAKVADMLPAYDAQSTAVTCNEIPKAIGDLYRLFIILLYSKKPIVTGAFSVPTLLKMIEMLEIFSGDASSLADRPRAVFDVCPSPPLIWSNFGAQNLIVLARARVPAELISMPLAGATAPVTLLGSVVQHAAESLCGIAIHQFANPGAPIVWGGAPAIFDMRHGSTPMGAIETAMIDIAYAQVGKSLGLPTHCYLGASDAKVVDVQAGFESGISTILGAIAGINMISGAGMLDFLACQSPEKLVIDAVIIDMAKRLKTGIKLHTETLALTFFEDFHFKGDFLKQRLTRELFPIEQYLPPYIVDRDSMRGWQADDREDAFMRARERTRELINNYQKPELDPGKERALRVLVESAARNAGMENLPSIEL